MPFFTPTNVGKPTQEERMGQGEQQFQPTWDEQTTRQRVKEYGGNEAFYTETDRNRLRQHSSYYGLPFYEGEFDLLDAFKQAGAGFFEGFTTFNLMEPADNEYEQIFRNLGHLAGFAPGLLAAPLGLAAKATKLTALKSLTNTAKVLNDKSVPMFGAKIITNKAKEIIKPALTTITNGRAEATADALSFLTGSKARHIAEGAFHLGTASAISSWQGGVDEMMHSFMGGAMAGGVFRGIGNIPLKGTRTTNKVIRGVAGSLFMGLPATMRGATTPEQVYEYVMGAYFGKGERPSHIARGNKFLNDVMKRAQKDPEQKVSYDPELHPGWPSLNKLEKEYVLRKSKDVTGPLETMRLLNEVLVKEGVDPNKLKELPAEIEGFEVSKTKDEAGTTRYKIKKEVLDKFKTIMFTGGAEGVDQYFAQKLSKKDKTAIINYTFKEHEWSIADAKGFKQVLKPKELSLSNKMVEKAARALKKETPNDEYILNLIRRNWYQVKHADAVYAVGKIEDGSGKETYKGANDALDPSLRNKAMRGGTGWAIEMAKTNTMRKNTPIYVFDQYVNKWNKFNYKSGFFEPIKGMPPKPPRAFAGIGTRKLEKSGEAAIDKLLDTGFRETGKATKKEMKEIAEAKAKGRAKYRYRIDMLEERIDEIELSKKEALEEWNRLTKNREDTKAHKEAENLAQRQHNLLERELREVIKERDSILKSGETELINLETGEAVAIRKLSQIDSDVTGQGKDIGKTAYDFVEKNFKELWDTPGLPWAEKIKIKNEYALRLEEELNANRTFNFENKSNEVVKWALKTLKDAGVEQVITQEDRGHIRQLMARANLEAQITIMGANEKGITNITRASTDIPNTLGGELRLQREPVKVIEHVFNELTQMNNKDIVATVDHITVPGKNGRLTDMSIHRWREQLINNNKYQNKMKQERAEESADKQVAEWKATIMRQMSRQNYYYFGGRGDADRMFFVKMHPFTKQHMHKSFNSLVNVMKFQGEMSNVNKMRDIFLKEYTGPSLTKNQAEKMFWESATSNLLYDLSMNGFKNLNTKAGFDRAIDIFFNPNNSFISSSKAFNKRSQIWFTNGFAGDKKFIKEYVKDMNIALPKDAKIYVGDAPIVYDTKTPIRKGGTDIVAAQTIYDSKGRVKEIRINPERLKQLYKEKAWTKPKVEGVDPLPKNAFKTYNEFEAFVIGHEQGHAKEGKGPSRSNKEAYAANENKMNQYGLEAAAKYREQTGDYNYILSRDLPQSILNKMDPKHKDYEPRYSENIKRLSTELGESIDGAIIVRDDVLSAINRDAGMPILKTQNKSFIVSPHSEHGAFLGKYMMHAAGPAMTKHMGKKGLHMIVQDSAAKQIGARKMGDYDVNKKELNLKGSAIYQLNPEHVFYNYSVKNDHKMANDVRAAKQFLGMILDNAKTPFQKEAIDSMVDRLLSTRFEGQDQWNKRYDSFINMDAPNKEKNVDFLIRNIDKISIPRLLDGLRQPHNELFAEAAYRHLILKEKEGITEDWNSGDLTNEEYHRALSDIQSANTAYDAKIKAAKAAAGKGNFFGIFFDKTVRNYREQVIRNFVVRETTKPKVENSLLARMRPYDKAMRQDLDGANPLLKKANKDDTLFFLDNYYADNTMINTGIESIGRISLKELWNKRNTEEFKNVDIDAMLNAAVLRVPLDSMSGVHNLKFGGFTGRDGHGILLHSKVMRALGGADLDGDEAFVYFGGNKRGLKKEWLDIIKANKSEFYETDTKTGETYVGDNKGAIIPESVKKALRIPAKFKTYRDLLTKDADFTPEYKELIQSRGAMYTIPERLRISNAATQGRMLLGSAAVTPKQTMGLTHSLLMNAQNQRDQFDIVIDGKPYQLTITPKTAQHYRDYARALGRAQVGFSSDPMDELGFKSRDFWFKELHKAHFNTFITEKVGNKFITPAKYAQKGTKLANLDKIDASQLKKGLYKGVKEIDSALWGRNWTDNRRWTMDEIRERTAFANSLNNEQQSSFFIQAARKISGLDWTDTALGRANDVKVALMYKEFAGNLKKYPELMKVLGRSSLKVMRSAETKATLKHELTNPDRIAELAENVLDFNTVLDIKPDKSGTFGTKKGVVVDYNLLKEAYSKNEFKAVEARKKILREIAIQGEDYFLNDINDIGTFFRVSKLYNAMNKTERKRTELIHKFVEYIKDKSYLMAKDRKKVEDFNWQNLNPGQLEIIKEIIANPKLKFFKGLLPQHYTKLKKQRSAVLDRNTIDAKILKFRKNPGTVRKPLKGLSAKENLMLDYLILGTYRRGDLDAIMELEAGFSKKKMNPGVKSLISYLKSAAAKTSSSRLGWESEAVRDESKARMVAPIVNAIQSTFKAPNEAEIQRLEKLTESSKEKAEFAKDKKVFEEEMDIELQHSTGFEGLNKGVEMSDVPAKYRPLLKELVGHLKTQSPHFRQNFNEVVRNLLGKEINSLVKYDYEVLNNWFRDIKNGTWLQRWFSKGKITELHQRHYWLFPRTINRELMRDGIELMEEKGMFVMQSGKSRLGKTQRPTHFVEITRDWITRVNDSSAKTSELMIQGLQNEMLFVNSFEDGEVLRQIAVRQREKGYWEFKKQRDNGLSQEDHINAREYENRYRDIINNHSGKMDKTYTIEIDGKRVEKKGREIVELINEKYTNFFKNMHEFITGKLDDKGRNIALEQYRYDWHDRGTQRSPKLDVKSFINDLYKGWREGKDIVTDIGIDGLRSISRQMMIDMTGQYKEFQKTLKMNPPSRTGKIPYEYYFPHLFFNKKIAGQGTKDYLKRVYEMELKEFSKDPEKAQKRKDAKMRQLLHKYHSLTGDWTFEEAEEWMNFDAVRQGIAKNKADAKQKIKWFSDLRKAGSMFSRTNHIPGWSIEASAPEAYARALVNTYHRQLGQVFARDIMGKMKLSMGKTHPKAQVEAWQNFMHLYVQDALGQPSVIPDSYLKNPAMKLRGTPYAWWADSNVEKKANKIMETFGIKQSDLPKEMRGIDVHQLRAWSNLEAQFEMAALLAHPKSMVTNVFGGTMHTVESAGWKNWRNSRNIDWLRQNINSKWKSMEDVMQFVVKNGVLPEYLLYEAGLNKEMQQVKNKEFIKDVAAKMIKDPNMKDTTLREIAAKHNVKDRVVQFAAKFMTVPERHIRRDAFMAHYIQAWERWGGAVKDPEHPFLIEQAKRGVKATQFLYNAPHRPAFARTALGKVMTRFQLWSWNAVSFRNDVFRQAKLYGFKPGTEAYERYARTMQIDLFVFALANMFAYSLFETALPAPWNWMQDTADWIFGNEKERDRAFFGQWPKQLAPLQMVTPPILRLLPSSMRAMIDDDWSKVSKYYVWTMMPFGRILRDTFGEGNLIENPIRIMEKTTGFPLLQLQRQGTKLSEDFESGERELPPTPGGGLSPFGLFDDDDY